MSEAVTAVFFLAVALYYLPKVFLIFIALLLALFGVLVFVVTRRILRACADPRKRSAPGPPGS